MNNAIKNVDYDINEEYEELEGFLDFDIEDEDERWAVAEEDMKEERAKYKIDYNNAINEIRTVLCNNAIEIDPTAVYGLCSCRDDDRADEPKQIYLIDNYEDAKRFSYLTNGEYNFSFEMDLYMCGVYTIGIEWHEAFKGKEF